MSKSVVVNSGLPFAGEEIESNFGYPDGFRIRTVQEQVETLLKHFQNLDTSYIEELAKGALPESAEGWAVIPKPKKVGKTYYEALSKAIALIAKNRKFHNWQEEALTEWHLRPFYTRAVVWLNEQPGDFWVVPFQFGLKWRGHSVRNAEERFADNEYGLGPYEVAILLLTHPDRLTGSDQLCIDCAGSDYRPDAEGNFNCCLDFYWDDCDKQLVLSYNGSNRVYEQWGTASCLFAQ